MTIISTTPVPVDESDLLEVELNSATVAPILPDYDDSDTEFTVAVGETITVTGKFAVGDQKFRVPFKRVDTGRIVPMEAVVENGLFVLTLIFPTAGEWEVTTDLLNSKLPEPLYHVTTHTFFAMDV